MGSQGNIEIDFWSITLFAIFSFSFLFSPYYHVEAVFKHRLF